MPAITLTRAEEWLYSVLTTDTVIAAAIGSRVFRHPPSTGADFPVVTFLSQAAPITKAVGSFPVMTRHRYLVRAIDYVDSVQGTIKTLADRIADLLSQSSGTVSDGTVISCVLLGEFSLTEAREGERYEHLGSFVEVLVQA